MARIQTLVFFDLETTGIPANRAKVTEITLISVSRSDLEKANGQKLPAINKLSLLCNPTKTIQPTASKLTELTNEYLKNQPLFKDNINCINSFLDKPKPVCLIAHNGNRFDFKILQAEYKAANEVLPNGLVCVDSLNAFRKILKDSKYFSNNTMHNNSTSSLDESGRVFNYEKHWQDLSMEETQEIDELVSFYSQLNTTQDTTKHEKKIKVGTPKAGDQLISPVKSVLSNSSSSSMTENDSVSKYKEHWQDLSIEETQEIDEVVSQYSQLNITPNTKKRGKNSEIETPKFSYKLVSLYEKLLNKNAIECHRAEADCMMLLECAIATKHDFLNYADTKHITISQI